MVLEKVVLNGKERVKQDEISEINKAYFHADSSGLRSDDDTGRRGTGRGNQKRIYK